MSNIKKVLYLFHNTSGFVSLADKVVKTLTFLEEPRAWNEKWTIGQEQVVIEDMVALLCGGHTLLVSKSGLAKTRPVDMLEKVFELSANWVQSKPDLMPEDILDPEILGINNDYALAFLCCLLAFNVSPDASFSERCGGYGDFRVFFC